MFDSAKLKIDRANEHIGALQHVLQSFIHDNSGALIKQLNEKNGPNFITFEPGAAPKSIPLIMGDIAHNLRAALDHVAGEIVRDKGGNDLKGHFPISVTIEATKQAINTHVRPYDESVANAILNEIYADHSKDHPIVGINSLDNIDKHRRLTFSMTVTGVTGSLVFGSNIIKNLTVHRETGGGAPAIIFTGGLPNNFQENISPTADIVFGKGEAFEGKSVIPTLIQCSKFISDAVRICESARTIKP